MFIYTVRNSVEISTFLSIYHTNFQLFLKVTCLAVRYVASPKKGLDKIEMKGIEREKKSEEREKNIEQIMLCFQQQLIMWSCKKTVFNLKCESLFWFTSGKPF